MTRKPLILAAVVPGTEALLTSWLSGLGRLLFVTSYAEAVKRLAHERGIALIVAAIRFDESRMFDLMRHREARHPSIPFICCRMVEGDVPRVFLEAVEMAAGSCGSLLLDFPALAARSGPSGARRALREEVKRRLAGA